MRVRIRSLRSEGGQAIVELALVLPLVLLFLFGIIDFGLALNMQNSDTNVANMAARTAAVIGSTSSMQCQGTPEATLQAWAECEATATGGPAVSSVCVADTAGATPIGTYTAGDPITVEVKSNFSWLKLITSKVGNLSSTISASATMRLEQAPGANTFLSPTCST
jgi:Flp pilus assembly protein TadG